MGGRSRHDPEQPDLDEKTKAKITTLYRDHDVTKTALQERFGCSITAINTLLREAGEAV